MPSRFGMERTQSLKERLFGLTGPEGNHGEDVKEQYFYLAATPTYSYAKALYKYPQAEFPYTWLVNENRRRGKLDPEFELVDTGIFNENRYFDVFVEYAKNSPDDILIRLTVANRGPEAATLHLLPNIWFRNDWSWGKIEDGSAFKPGIALEEQDRLSLNQESLGRFFFVPALIPQDAFRPHCLPKTKQTHAGSGVLVRRTHL